MDGAKMMPMSIPFALQLWSVRDVAQTDLMDTLARVADFGYKGVEFAGLQGHTPDAVRRRLDEVGLRCVGTHTTIDRFSDANLAATIEEHHTLGTDIALVPWIPAEKRNTVESTTATARELTDLSEKLAENKLRTGFHVHNDDLHPLPGSERTAWDLIRTNTPDSFIMQWDTANGQSAGVGPLEPLREAGARAVSIHLKEFPTDGRIIGEGQIPWFDVMNLAKEVGVQNYVVEIEQYAHRTSLDAVRDCLYALQQLGY